MFGQKILVLAAHPDDEVVACAAAIGRAKAQGARVGVLFLSHGCLARETVWPWKRRFYEQQVDVRRQEAETVAEALGVDFWALSERPARAVWRELPQVYGEVLRAVAHYGADQVWVPAYEGGNPDHDALSAVGFVLKTAVSVLEFSEYNFFGRKVRSQTFFAPDATTQVVALTEEEKLFKKKLLGLYASERGNLSALGVDQESYRPLAAYDYAKSPHEGTLWYARFQWVPFRHPRVDFTQPEEVSAALGAFLARPFPFAAAAVS